ncbi:MAG: hypothetical protein H0T46_29605, partial [Deltaproteobacteria bacterium]|nr:hypothetical protein [Deltaproteobacteria bacterium]
MATSKSTLAGNSGGEPLTVAQLLALHPFPAEYEKEKRIERLWTFDLPCTPEKIWPHIADTSRMNRSLGTAEMFFEERDGKRFGSSKPGGVKHEWVEVPWNWVANQWLTCLRIYERGFMRVMYAIHRVDPTPTGSRVYLYFGAVPRGALGSAALRLGFPSIEKAYKRVLPSLGEQIKRLEPAQLMTPAPTLDPNAEQRLKAQHDALIARGLDRACVDTLFAWIRT